MSRATADPLPSGHEVEAAAGAPAHARPTMVPVGPGIDEAAGQGRGDTGHHGARWAPADAGTVVDVRADARADARRDGSTGSAAAADEAAAGEAAADDEGTHEAATHEAVGYLATARSPEVAATDPWAEAGRKVMRFHLARMLARVPGTIEGTDAEEVHAMRVATRRVRAAWRVFGGGFERPVVQDQVRQLRVLGSSLGTVRDLDVQIAILDAYQSKGSRRDRTALAPLAESLAADRSARHAELASRLESPWFSMFVTDLVRLLATPGAAVRPAGPHAPSSVRMQAPAVAWKAYQVVWGFDGGLAGADVATLHELRIAAKWLRYTLEFLREPMEPVATDLIRRVVALQDLLGDVHDLHAAAERGRAFALGADDLRPGHRVALERFVAAEDARSDRIRRRLGPTWRGMTDAEFRRGLGRALARL